ncbi:hypothetical protein GXP75_15405 [Bacillus sp. HU-1818]|uniref:hypothetical protein n=1 Tax=Bacillus TaxID=1386 RepID=UPI001EFAE1E4|nr:MULTISPECIES: hypothetical protein [Bacillus]MCG8397517.1 hypothetical protein [Bacillus atrophaeus]MCI3197028.1 hypothetical protein [Bacillus sp. HU-1818]
MRKEFEHTLEKNVYCSRCKNETKHSIIKSHRRGSFQEIEPDFHWQEAFHIVECAGCQNISFVNQYGDEDTWEYDSGEKIYRDVYRVYPEKPIEDTQEYRIEQEFKKRYWLKVKQFSHVPSTLYNLYEQIIQSYNENLNILCASGLRILLEGICKDLNVKKGFIYNKNKQIIKKDGERDPKKRESLEGKFFGLYDDGYILFNHALILQKILYVGNGAIHEIVEPDKLVLKQIINIVESILENTYELEHHELLKED